MLTSISKDSIRFRQVHLDFHTGGDIPGVGNRFNAQHFQQTLLDSAVDSITCFAVCHHGYCYYPSKIGPQHPTLQFNLLRSQLDAAHAVGIHVPVYISAGGNEIVLKDHPEWAEVPPEGMSSWGGAGNPPLFHKLCFNTEYLDYLCQLTSEVTREFPDADGLFFDIVFQGECLCPSCQAEMKRLGMDAESQADRQKFGTIVMQKYYDRITEAVQKVKPDMPIFHNSAHVNPMFPQFMKYYSHWELESLPTGGWGYDHFPLTAAFARQTGFEFTGMTGKFNRSWGEFGGIKTPEALRYECCAMLASGARCSIGDQCHPCGELDASTYAVIGEAFREVREKEPFCIHAVNRAEIALIATDLFSDAAIGVSRLLQEGHFLFDVFRPDMDYEALPMAIVPDGSDFTETDKARLASYVRKGGKLLCQAEFARELDIDFGADFLGPGKLYPSYLLPEPEFRPSFLSTPFACFTNNYEMKPTTGQSLGQLFYPYFNRTPEHFCGHQYTPNQMEPTDLTPCIIHGNVAVLALPLFASYAQQGAVVLKEFLVKLIERVVSSDRLLKTNLPSMGRILMTEDKTNSRFIVHLLYANMLKRGDGIEIIDELLPLHNIQVSVNVHGRQIQDVYLEPQHKPIPFTCENECVRFTVKEFTCHQMIALNC